MVADGLNGRTAGPPGAPIRGGGVLTVGSADQQAKRRTFVNIIEKPSPELADFLDLGPEERENGFVLKGRSYRQEFGKEQSAWEVYVMERHIPRHHPLFFSLLKAFRSPQTGNIYLILPRACCDLSQYYRDAPRSINVQIAAAEMAMSLSLLHRRGFLHRDVKPPNYFVSQSGHVLLADFEMLWPISLPCPQEEATHTRGFTAPELRRMGAFAPFSIKTDVYALGMAYARLVMRVRKYQKVPNEGAFVRLILKMVANDVHERIDLDTVMTDPYFNTIDWTQIERGDAPPPCPLAKQVMHRFAAARRNLQQQEQQQQEQEQRRRQQQQQEQQQQEQEQEQQHEKIASFSRHKEMHQQQETERHEVQQTQHPQEQQQEDQQQQQQQQQQEGQQAASGMDAKQLPELQQQQHHQEQQQEQLDIHSERDSRPSRETPDQETAADE